jgi:hypothetical protein
MIDMQWSFAIITDFHIGCFLPDYGKKGWELDGGRGEGEEYFLTRRLRRAVDWINAHNDKPGCPILFAAVLGDLTDSAEGCEFLKAREILGGLEVPYVPLLGNHDVWPYTSYENSGAPMGLESFLNVFWQRLESLRTSEVIRNWEMDTREVNGTPLINYAFDVEGIHFIALDCVNRERRLEEDEGVSEIGVFHEETREWLERHLDRWKAEPVILLSHHPLSGELNRLPQVPEDLLNNIRLMAYVSFTPEDYRRIADSLRGRKGVLADFAGHVHCLNESQLGTVIWDFNRLFLKVVEGMEVVVTEAVASGSNQTVDKGMIRLVEVMDNGTIDYGTLVDDDRPALNPHLECRRLEDGSCELIPHSFSTREVEYRWELSDGHMTHWSPLAADEKERTLIHEFKEQGQYPRATLIMRDRGHPDFTEEISQEV